MVWDRRDLRVASDPARRSRGSLRLDLGLSAAATALFLAWLIGKWGGEWTTTVVDDIGIMIPPFLAAAACGLAARRSSGVQRWSWALFAASAASWGLGEAAWSYYELVRHQAPFPSLADVGFLGAIPLAVVALLVQVASAHRSATFARAVLDGLIISLSLLFTSWDLLVGPIVRAGGDSLLVQTLTLAYPLGDVVVIAVVVFALTRAGDESRTSAGLVGAGLVAISIADSAFALFNLTGDYSTGLYADAGWFLGFLLMAAGARAATGSADGSDVARTPSRISVALPYIPVSVSVVLAVVQILSSETFDPILWGVGVTLWIAVIGRQLATLFEDIALVRLLEEKVEERTTELREAGIALERRERHFRSLVQNASDLIVVTGRGGEISYVSPSARRILGRTPEQLKGLHLDALVHPDDGARVPELLVAAEARPRQALSLEWRLSHADGSWRVMETAVTAQFADDAVQGLVLNSRDVTERRLLEERLRHEALHDSLTGLPNRTLFRDRLEHALAAQTRLKGHLALLFVDVDDFKIFNDSADHAVGDQVLRIVGARLDEAVRPGDTVARVGGDEFAVLLANLSGPEESELIAERILVRINQPMEVDGRELRASASVGISLDESGASSADELLRQADLAMYIAKGKGKATYRTFQPEMHTAMVERMSLKADLAAAVGSDDFLLHYQPVVELRTGRVTGVEALMRWAHPRLGMVSPVSFIPLAEESGTIVPLGEWALHEACRQAVAWDQDGPCGGLEISVNLSARQLETSGIVGTVARVLAQTGLAAERLILEVTETVLMEDIDAIVEVLNDLRALGVRLAIDDFGTGYSSLAYLARLPVQVMKIDRSFIRDLAEEGRVALVRSMRQLGREFGMKTVAEGVESPEIAAALLGLGCDYAQGYWTTPPLPPQELEQFLGGRAAATEPGSYVNA